MQTAFVPIHGDSPLACTPAWPCNVCFATLSTERQAEIMEAAAEIRAEAFSEGADADRCTRCKNFTLVQSTSIDSDEKVCEICEPPLQRMDDLQLQIVGRTEKFAFIAISLPENSVGLFGLGVVVRDEPGYHPMPDYCCNSNSRERVEGYARELNTAMGLDQEAVDALVMSSMRAQNNRARHAIGPVHD